MSTCHQVFSDTAEVLTVNPAMPSPAGSELPSHVSAMDNSSDHVRQASNNRDDDFSAPTSPTATNSSDRQKEFEAKAKTWQPGFWARFPICGLGAIVAILLRKATCPLLMHYHTTSARPFTLNVSTSSLPREWVDLQVQSPPFRLEYLLPVMARMSTHGVS